MVGNTKRLLPRDLLRVLLAVLSIAAVCAVGASRAEAHLMLPNGTWTAAYFTRSNDSAALANCNDGNAGAVDPVSVVVWQYGEFQRIFDHLEDETDFGPQTFGSSQVICATTDGVNYTTHVYWDDQTGHGNLGTRAHFRQWFAPHPHGGLLSKWSLLTPHHESCCAHDPDEPWETWEFHVVDEMDPHHNIVANAYYRAPADFWRGFWHDGYMTRIGGLHDGSY